MNENTSLFGNGQLQIELKPHSAVEAVEALAEAAPAYTSRAGRNDLEYVRDTDHCYGALYSLMGFVKMSSCLEDRRQTAQLTPIRK